MTGPCIVGQGEVARPSSPSTPGRARRWFTAAALANALLGVAACNRLRVPGDVRDAEGRAIEGCRVELLVQTPLSDSWTGTVSREAITDPAGQFSFDVLVVRRSNYRLRIAHPGYQEWLHEGTWPDTPRRYHITLLRQPSDGPAAKRMEPTEDGWR